MVRVCRRPARSDGPIHPFARVFDQHLLGVKLTKREHATSVDGRAPYGDAADLAGVLTCSNRVRHTWQHSSVKVRPPAKVSCPHWPTADRFSEHDAMRLRSRGRSRRDVVLFERYPARLEHATCRKSLHCAGICRFWNSVSAQIEKARYPPLLAGCSGLRQSALSHSGDGYVFHPFVGGR